MHIIILIIVPVIDDEVVLRRAGTAEGWVTPGGSVTWSRDGRQCRQYRVDCDRRPVSLTHRVNIALFYTAAAAAV